MIPSVGRIVHYKISDYEAANSGFDRMSDLNRPAAGEVYPMLIVRVWASEPTEGTAVNGRVFLDGQHDLWVTSRVQGDGPGQWSDPAPPAVDAVAAPEPEPQPEQAPPADVPADQAPAVADPPAAVEVAAEEPPVDVALPAALEPVEEPPVEPDAAGAETQQG